MYLLDEKFLSYMEFLLLKGLGFGIKFIKRIFYSYHFINKSATESKSKLAKKNFIKMSSIEY